MSLATVLGKVKKVPGKIKKVLTVITDLLLVGRSKGWWDKKHGLPVRRK